MRCTRGTLCHRVDLSPFPPSHEGAGSYIYDVSCPTPATLNMSIAEDEPGVPGNFDDDGKPYFFPGNQQRPADAREQRDGFVPRWKYRGHSGDNIKGIQATGRDAFGRIRFVSTDGPSIHSWLEGGDSDSVKIGSSEHMINALTFVRALNVVAAASVRFFSTSLT